MSSFSVRGTQARPAWMPLFVLSRNNLNPLVAATDDGLVIKVMTTNRLPWAAISGVTRQRGLRSHVLKVTCGGWEYVLHFATTEERARLEARLAEAGVPVPPLPAAGR